MSNKFIAIQNLYENVVTAKENEDNTFTAYDNEGNEVKIDMTQVNAWVNPEQYKYERKNEYPNIGDQLDDLFHAGAFSEEMTATLQAVKDKYPKE